MSKVRIAMDAALEPPEELELPTTKPMGYAVPHLPGRDYALISEAKGRLGYFAEETLGLALPFLRMLCREADAGKRRYDFRIYRWLPDQGAWTIHQRTVLMEELRERKAA